MEKDVWQPLKDNPEVQILGLDMYDGSPTQLNLFRNITGATFPLLRQASKVGSAYGVTTTDLFVVDRNGIIQLYIDIAESLLNFEKAQKLITNLVLKNPIFTLSSKSLYFGQKAHVGESKTLQIEIRNTGSFDLQITGFRSTAAGLSMEPESLTVPGGENRDVLFTLTPERKGSLSGEIQFLHPHQTLGPVKIPLIKLTVEGSLPPSIALPLDRVDFGEVEVGRSVQKDVTVRNDGAGPLKVTEIRSGLPDIQVSESAFTIPAGGDHTLTVTFLPQAEGDLSGVLDLISNDPNQTTVTVTLSGTAKIIPADPRSDFDGNGQIGFTDFVSLVRVFNTVDPAFDLDGSGLVDFGDFLIFARSFGKPVN